MDTSSNLSSTFSEVCTATRTGDLRWTAEIDPRWTILGNPNGGYLQALMAQVATGLSPEHPSPVAVSTHFLRSPRPGTVDLTADLLRAGRTTTQVQVRMSQEGKVTGETTVTLGSLADNGAPDWVASGLPQVGHPFADCPRYRAVPGAPEVAIYEELGIHPEPGQSVLTTGEARGTGEVRAWVDLPGGEDFSPLSLLLAADVLPPAPLDLGASGWVPTMELSTYVRALPAPGPVNVLLRANVIQGGRVDETATVWDSSGALVAQSHQLAAVRFGG